MNLNILLLLCVVSISQCEQHEIYPTYTNKQASDCFTERGVAQCKASIKKCTDDTSCKEELATYQSCSFGLSETEIFNGYCFRKWRQNAVLTKEMIDCLSSTCNLQYNSAISVEKLYRCSQETVINNFLQCDDACGEELQKIRNGWAQYPLEELFSQPINNEAANKIVGLIKLNCIDNQYVEQKRENTPASSQNTQPNDETEVESDKQVQESQPQQENTQQEQAKIEEASTEQTPEQVNEPEEQL